MYEGNPMQFLLPPRTRKCSRFACMKDESPLLRGSKNDSADISRNSQFLSAFSFLDYFRTFDLITKNEKALKPSLLPVVSLGVRIVHWLFF